MSKVFKNQDELDGICDYIVDNIDLIFEDAPKKEELSDYILKFKQKILTVNEHYLYNLKTKNCKKSISNELYSLKDAINTYKESLPEERKVTLRTSTVRNFGVINDLLKNCLITIPSSKVKTGIDYYKKDAKKVLSIFTEILRENIISEIQTDIVDFQTNTTTKKKFRFFLLNTKREKMTDKEMSNVLSTIHAYDEAIRVMIEDPKLQNEEIKNYIFSMLNMWRKNMNKIKDPYLTHTLVNKQLISYCALIILKRVLLAILLILEDQKDVFVKYIDIFKPDLDTLDDMMKTALNIKQQKRTYTDMMIRLKDKIEQKLREKLEQQKLRGTYILPPSERKKTDQKIKQMTQITQILKQLGQEIKKKEYVGKKKIVLQQQQQQYQRQQHQRQQQRQQQQQQQQQQQSKKQKFMFEYVSPNYQHRQDDRILPEQNKMLQQRKLKNMENIQSSIVSQSIPARIMEIAMQGKYSSIFLVDVANQKRDFGTEQQMLSNINRLTPLDVPKVALRKPLYVLIEQADLDESALPKATFDDSSNILRIRVSCVKQTKDNRKIDCYKKEKQERFTKNPMDDFVLLTLRYALRSYYYNYRKYMGFDSKILENLDNVEYFLVNNPFNLLAEEQEEDIGNIVRETYKKVKFDKKVPYTWIISNDQWKDWKRKK